MIHWFPGHMAKALNQIDDKQTLADLFIIVLDARCPISSYNEEFDHFNPKAPRLFIISKSDLSDQEKLPALIKRFNSQNSTVITVNLIKKKSKKIIEKAASKLLESKIKADKAKGLLKPRLRVFVMGVPNSGKSTLINLMAGAKKAKVGNYPGVTRGQQWIKTETFHLLDTPGILWPKFDDELIGIKLAIIGSIKIKTIPKQELFNEQYKLLSKYYPKKIITLGLKPSQDEAQIYSNFYKLAKTKNFLLKNKNIDDNKTYAFFNIYVKLLKGVTFD